jgi:DNA-binding ferritin-like protein
MSQASMSKSNEESKKIAQMLKELKENADRIDRPLLSYLIDVARMEADDPTEYIKTTAEKLDKTKRNLSYNDTVKE